METIAFLEALVRALGHGWSARYGMIAPYGVFGVTLTSDVGGTVEVVPSLVRGDSYQPGETWAGGDEWFGGPSKGVQAAQSVGPEDSAGDRGGAGADF